MAVLAIAQRIFVGRAKVRMVIVGPVTVVMVVPNDEGQHRNRDAQDQ